MKLKDISFRLVVTQLILAVALTIFVIHGASLPSLLKAGKESATEVTEEVEAEEADDLEVEHDKYAYAHLNFPGAWLIAAPFLWMMPEKWSAAASFDVAFAITTMLLSAILAIIEVARLTVHLKELKASHSDDDQEKLALLKERLPFNRWSLLYLALIIFGCYADWMQGWEKVFVAVAMIVIELIRTSFYHVQEVPAARHQKKIMKTAQLLVDAADEVARRQQQQIEAAQQQVQQAQIQAPVINAPAPPRW